MGKRAAFSTLAASALAVGTAAIAGPAAASAAPTIAVTNPKACFVNTYTMAPTTGAYTEHNAIIDVKGSGWTPGASVAVNFAQVQEAIVKTAGPDGTFTGSFKVPEFALGFENTPAFQSAPLTATDDGNADGSDPGGATATSGPVDFTDREVGVWEDVKDVYGGNSDFFWSDKVYFRASGFTPGKIVYAHYLDDGATYRANGKLVTTTALGRATGPCGTVTTHRTTIFPFKAPEADYGDYTIQYSSSRAYSARSTQYSWIFNLGL